MAPGKAAQPSLPKKKAASGNGKKAAAAGGKELPIAFAQFITLEDGTQVSRSARGSIPACATLPMQLLPCAQAQQQ